VVGGGYFIDAGSSANAANISVYENYPSSDTVWTVKAAEDGLSGGVNWWLQAWVICVETS
jgi:hypothetical protein